MPFGSFSGFIFGRLAVHGRYMRHGYRDMGQRLVVEGRCCHSCGQELTIDLDRIR